MCKESSRFCERPARGRITARHFRTICAVPNDAFPRRSFEVCATGRIAKRVSFPKRWNVQDRTCVRRLAPTFPLVFSDYCVSSAEMAAKGTLAPKGATATALLVVLCSRRPSQSRRAANVVSTSDYPPVLCRDSFCGHFRFIAAFISAPDGRTTRSRQLAKRFTPSPCLRGDAYCHRVHPKD